MQQYGLLCLLILCISRYCAQDSSAAIPLSTTTATQQPPTTTVTNAPWFGDPDLCTVNPTVPFPPDRPLPIFPNQAEFALERVEIRHLLNLTEPSQLTIYEYLYDYDANKLIRYENKNGFTDVEYYYYEIKKKSTYYRREYCVVSDIPVNLDMDGNSAILLPNGTGHIRPLNELLLFSSNDPRELEIRPRFVREEVIRGIPVDTWETCIIDKATYKTVRRIWSFASKGVSMPTGIVNVTAVPVQALISASFVLPNGTRIVEIDEIYNVLSFRPGIIESIDQLSPPKGVFCNSGPGQNLISLENIGIEWPDRFSVRIEASTSRGELWQGFHLRYDRGRERGSRRIRYDYMPPGAEDYQSVIHDFGQDLTYYIDRRIGSCKINRGVQFMDVNPARDPIEFFIRHERYFIFSPRQRAWEYNGLRSCRGNSIKCMIVTSQIEKFPVIIDPDTGKPSGETWETTNVEFGWTQRSPSTRQELDYPVHLFLKLFRFGNPNNPSPADIRTEDIEYEFYEMSHEIHPSDFDISICYRSLNYEYLHLGFTLKLSQGSIIDGNHLDRRELERRIHGRLVFTMGISYSRISEIEVDHEIVGNDVSVLFTLLGPTPRPESPTGLATDEPTAEYARGNLTRAIDDGRFRFTMDLTDNSSSSVEFVAKRGSLNGSKQFMSSHANGQKVVNESYTSGSQAGAIIGGILIGLIVGILIAAVIRIVRKEPMPAISSLQPSFSNPLPNISFYNKKPTGDTTATTTTTTDA